MCGITGIISPNPQINSEERIKKGINSLKHRGPESEGVWFSKENKATLGHRRLSIIDLSKDADQPMHLENRYTIVYNGEIYNYPELKMELEKKGYCFRTKSDTEVLLACYDAWNSECLHHLNGMFSFAIWDEKEQKLFAGRDRFGEKPFFFFYNEEEFLFASEIKALLSMEVKKEVNFRMLYNYLTIGYTSNPSNPQETFYEQIHKLPAGSYLIYDTIRRKLEIEKYYIFHAEKNSTLSEKGAIEKFSYLFTQSIHYRLRSDVSIGTSLSGGLDSSAIVALCQKENTKQYSHQCFTAVFPGFEKDESIYAAEVANRFQLKQNNVIIDRANIVSLMEKVMESQDEPIGSASVLAQYSVYEAARQNGVIVLLDGQGADEIIAGYTKYYRSYWRELYHLKKLKASCERIMALQMGVTEAFGYKDKIAALFPELSAALWQSKKAKLAYRHSGLNRDFAFSHKRDLYYTTPTEFTLNGALYFNTFINGLEELLRYADRNSMAHSTEVRLPFLDHELVEFIFSLPPSFKIHNGWTKWLLRKSIGQELPEKIVWRKDKTGFEPPQKTWMEEKKVHDAITEGRRKLVKENVLESSLLNKTIKPHDAYAAYQNDWRYWSASFLF